MAERFEIRKSENNKFYFVLIAPNNEIIAQSEMYNEKSSCIDGINSVKRYAPTAPTVDKTI